MSDIFCDTSGIAKRYLAEIGSPWVRDVAARGSGNQVWLNRITIAEFASVVSRRCREGLLTQAERDHALATFHMDAMHEYQFVEVDDALAWRARDLLLAHALRAYDAVQLASALLLNEALEAFELPPVLFVCADARLMAAACAEGLAVEDPLNHP